MGGVRCSLRVLGMLLAVAWLPALAGPPANWGFHRLDEALRIAGREQQRVFLYFGRQGCLYCDKVNRESFSDARVVEALNAHYVLAYVDSEGGEHLRLPNGERLTEMELGVRLQVAGTPFFYFMEADGAPIVRAPGFRSADELLQLDRYVAGEHYRRQSFSEFKTAAP